MGCGLQMDFKRSVSLILQFEGGYVFDSQDPGGETKYGISKRSHPYLDIKNLTEPEAIELYKAEYWDPLKPLLLPRLIRLCLFDAAVNQGVNRAIKFLQEAIGTEQDGIVGPLTIKASSLPDSFIILESMVKLRLNHYAKLPHWSRFGHGWTRRLITVLFESIKANHETQAKRII